MLVILWIGSILIVSWIFVILEFDNYEMVIKENLKLRQMIDNVLPVRDQLPAVLFAIADCPGNESDDIYNSLLSVYQEYSSSNTTL